jgi:hypothetical protein
MRRLAEPGLRLTALTGWVAPHRHGTAVELTTESLFDAPTESDPTPVRWELHWATLSPATDDHQGTAACGLQFDRDREWWCTSPAALQHALRYDYPWTLCGVCPYWAGGLP